jgi:hypothetical protein
MGIQDTVTDNVPRTEYPGSTTAIGRRLDVDGTGCETAVDGDDGARRRGRERREGSEGRTEGRPGESGEDETSGRLGRSSQVTG